VGKLSKQPELGKGMNKTSILHACSIQSNISDEDDSSASSSGWFHNAYPDFYLLLLQEDLGPVVSAEHLI
jgi:hypothetical protein